MVNAQRWLDANYSSWEKNKTDSLEIRSKGLEGPLKLEGFDNLKIIDCSSNKLTELQIVDGSKLEEVRCQYNEKLKELKFQGFPPKKLKILICNDNILTRLEIRESKELEALDVRDNNFSDQDLSFLNSLVNLKKLYLGNWVREKVVNRKLYNRFHGSLEFLKNMNKLERLDIRNTDISSGLEHLPDSVIYFCCEVNLRENAGVRKIFNLLNNQETIKLIDDGTLINKGFIEDFPARLRVFKELKQFKAQIEKLKKENAELKQFKAQIEKLKKENAEINTDLRYLVGSPRNIRKI